LVVLFLLILTLQGLPRHRHTLDRVLTLADCRLELRLVHLLLYQLLDVMALNAKLVGLCGRCHGLEVKGRRIRLILREEG